jgi:hypothetical protein
MNNKFIVILFCFGTRIFWGVLINNKRRRLIVQEILEILSLACVQCHIFIRLHLQKYVAHFFCGQASRLLFITINNRYNNTSEKNNINY